MTHKVKVSVWDTENGIFGSMIRRRKYEADSLSDTIKFLQEQMEKIPPEYRASAIFEIDSVGGYEGEHHAEASIYYYRPENEAERKARKQEEAEAKQARENQERQTLAALRAKYG